MSAKNTSEGDGDSAKKIKGHKLQDLNDHLFDQLERLNESVLQGEKLKEEIERSKAVGIIASKIIDNAKLALRAQETLGDKVRRLPKMIGNEDDGERE